MKISFIVPLYNCEDYIVECLQSLVSIKYNNFEIIVINDGSIDNSRNIVEDFALKYAQVKLINKNNEGLSITRNLGINIAKGDYLFFIDADDMVIPEQVDNIINLCLLNKYSVIAGTYLFLENNKIKNAPFILARSCENSLELNYLLTLPNYTAEAVKYVVKKDFLLSNEIHFESNIFHEDELYMPQLLVSLNNDTIKIHFEPFYIYRKHSNTITTNLNVKKSVDTLFICRELFNLSDKFKEIDELKHNFLIKRANLMYISVCTMLTQFSKEEQIMLAKNLSELHKKFSNNLISKKDRIAFLIIKLFGYKVFSNIQRIRGKK